MVCPHPLPLCFTLLISFPLAKYIHSFFSLSLPLLFFLFSPYASFVYTLKDLYDTQEKLVCRLDRPNYIGL